MDLSNATSVLFVVVSVLGFIAVALKMIAAGLDEVAESWVIFRESFKRFTDKV